QNDPGLGGAPRHVSVFGIGGQGLAVPLVGGETWEIDEREPDVGGSGELRRSEVADDLAAAALDGTGHGTRVRLEVSELGGVERVADAECDHGCLLVSKYGHAARVRPRGTLRSSPNCPDLLRMAPPSSLQSWATQTCSQRSRRSWASPRAPAS